jgi:hypothetical protein
MKRNRHRKIIKEEKMRTKEVIRGTECGGDDEEEIYEKEDKILEEEETEKTWWRR